MSDMVRELNQTQHRAAELEVLDVVPVVARYTTNAGQSLTGGATTIINFEDKDFDPRNAVTVGASWKFTAPIGGYYAVSAHVRLAGASTWAVGENFFIYLYKNNAVFSELFFSENIDPNTVAAGYGSDLIYLAAGDTIDIRVLQVSGGAIALATTDGANAVSIFKV